MSKVFNLNKFWLSVEPLMLWNADKQGVSSEQILVKSGLITLTQKKGGARDVDNIVGGHPKKKVEVPIFDNRVCQPL